MTDDSLSPLFARDGSLRLDRLEPCALETLDAAMAWLEEVGRAVLLPIDLIIVLCRRDHPLLLRTIAQVGRGTRDTTGVLEQLETLGRRIERPVHVRPRLHVDQLSLGLVGILEDALAWEAESGRAAIREIALARVVRWRAELQDSASVRWAIRQLGMPGADRLFDTDGGLRRNAFTPSLWSALQRAMHLSAQAGMPFLGTPHLVASLCLQPDGVLVRACRRRAVDPQRVHDDLLRIIGVRAPVQGDFSLSRRTLTPRLVRMLVAASERVEAEQLIREDEVLLAFLTDGGSSLELITSIGVEAGLREELGETPVAAIRIGRPLSPLGGMELDRSAGGASGSVLTELGRDLRAIVRRGGCPRILGRDQEIQRVINILLRREQRNPLLTGEAGVGKTALAIALATRIEEGTVPERLRDMRVIEINGASLVGGTSYRGELEARIQGLLREARENVILFMDEAHAIFAPQSGSGKPAEVPNHFKAALASGEIAVVAATTEVEYHRWMEQDSALQRRFERVPIPELSPTLTREILHEIAPGYEKDYGVPLTPDALDAAIELSQRFIPEQSLPDKAKKLLMDATIHVSSELALRAPATVQGAEGTPNKRVVTRRDVAEEVSRKTGIPMDRIVRGASMAWWRGLQHRLVQELPTQAAGVERTLRQLIRARLASDRVQVGGTAVALLAPAGSGRNQLARELAREVFGTERALLHLPMSDYQEAHSLSRLLGAAPGYVGYQDEDALVAPLRRRPGSVVLLSGFLQAHPRVQDRLLRVIREGEVSDTRGLRADTRHAIFLVTVDTEERGATPIGFGGERERSDALPIESELEERLRAAGVVPIDFRSDPPDAALLRRLVEERLAAFGASLREEHGVDLHVGDDVLQTLHQRCVDARGRHELERLFRELVVDPVTDELLQSAGGEPIVRIGRPAETFA